MHGRADDDGETLEAVAAGAQHWGRKTLPDAFSLLIYTAVPAGRRNRRRSRTSG